MVGKKSPHFVGALEIKLRRVAHPFFVLHHPAGPDANHDIVRFMMTSLEKMDVIRRDEAEPKFLRDLRQSPVAFSLRLEAMVVQFEEEILRSEDIAKSRRALARLAELIG